MLRSARVAVAMQAREGAQAAVVAGAALVVPGGLGGGVALVVPAGAALVVPAGVALLLVVVGVAGLLKVAG